MFVNRTVYAAAFLALAPICHNLIFAGDAAAQNVEIGVAAAINPAATGTPPSGERRVLHVGINMFSNEKVATGPKGQAQMLFRDESALTVGPDAEVVLDEFVYDPKAKTGKIALNAVKGVFRFVGGKISKKSPVVLKTPTATIGIRGGITLVNVKPDGATQAVFLFGKSLTVSAGGVTKTATRSGFAIETNAEGGPPSDPAPASAETLDAALGALEEGGGDDDSGDGTESAGGGSEGGGSESGGDTPQDSDVADSGISDLGSDQSPDAVAPESQSPLGGLASQTAAVAVDTTEVENTADTTSASQATASESTTSGGTMVGRYKRYSPYTLSTLNTLTGLVDTDTGNNGTFSNGLISGGLATATVFGTTYSLPVESGTFSVGSSSGSSPFGSASGTGVLSSSGNFLFYELTGSDNTRHFVFGGNPIDEATASNDSHGFEVFAFDLRDDFLNNTGSSLPFITSTSGGALTATESQLLVGQRNTSVSNSSSTVLQVSLGINGQGSSQTSVLAGMTGVFYTKGDGKLALGGAGRGSARTSSSGHTQRSSFGFTSVAGDDGTTLFGSPSSVTIENFVLDQTDVNSDGSVKAQLAFQADHNNLDGSYYGFDHVATAGTAPSGVGTTRTSRSMHGFTGGIQESRTSGGSFTYSNFGNTSGEPANFDITTNADLNRVSGEIDVTTDGSDVYDFHLGSVATSGTFSTSRGTFIDDNTFAIRDAYSSEVASNVNSTAVTQLRALLVNSEVATATDFLPSGVTLCSCSYSEWGWWVADIKRADSTNRDRVHLASWVAGVVSSYSAVSALTGTASFSGHAVGSVRSGSYNYVAAGNFSASVDFDSPGSSTISITDFDGGTFSATGITIANGTDSLNKYSASLTGSSGQSGRSGSLAGTFFTGSNAATETGGHFGVTGTNYQASGIFQATQ